MAWPSQGSKFLWDRNYRLPNSIKDSRNSETWIIAGCKTFAECVMLGFRISVTLQATVIILRTVKCYRLQHFCNMNQCRPHFCSMGHPRLQNSCKMWEIVAWVMTGSRISVASNIKGCKFSVTLELLQAA